MRQLILYIRLKGLSYFRFYNEFLKFYITAKGHRFSVEEKERLNQFFELPLDVYAETYSTGMLKKLYLLLLGHIMFTKTYVTKPDGSRYNTLMVAPLAVLLEYRSFGVGSALMKEGLRIAQTMGYQSAFLIGDPNYYQRFGYKLTHLYGINHKSMPAEYLQVKELTQRALDGVTGLINL